MPRTGRSRVRSRGLPGPSSPRKAKNYRVMCVTAYNLGCSSRTASKNLQKARDLITYYDTLFWEPIDTAPDHALFVDRLFNGVRNLARQTGESPLLARDAATIENILETLDDPEISALFAPYLQIITDRASGSFRRAQQLELDSGEEAMAWGEDA